MSRKGFTLVEILVALAILAIGATSAMSLLAAATAMHKKAVDQVNSAFIAETVVSEIESRMLTATGAVTPYGNGSVDGFPDYFYEFQLSPVDNSPYEYFVNVRVSWKEKGVTKIQDFQTILLRRIRYREKDYYIPPLGESGGYTP